MINEVNGITIDVLKSIDGTNWLDGDVSNYT